MLEEKQNCNQTKFIFIFQNEDKTKQVKLVNTLQY